jgi:type I restriction enzyme S subunit
VSLGEVCEFKYGKSLPEQNRSGSGYAVFGSNGELGRHGEAFTDGTTIIVGRKGSFGEVTYSDQPCWPIDTTYYVDDAATSADLRWLYYRMKALPLTELNRAAAIPGLNRNDAYAQRLLLPPIEEQRRIAAVLDAADALRTKRRKALAKLDTLTQAIFIDMFGDPSVCTTECLRVASDAAASQRDLAVQGWFGRRGRLLSISYHRRSQLSMLRQ